MKIIPALIILMFAVLFLVWASSSRAGDLNELVRLTNVERAKVGVAPLHTIPQLRHAAQDHTTNFAEYDYFEHHYFDGKRNHFIDWWTWISRYAFKFATIGENILWCPESNGCPTPADQVHEWMTSPEHKANMLNPQFNYIGVAHAWLSTGKWAGWFYAQEFASKELYTQ